MGRKRLDLRHILIFALLGTMQFCSKQALEFAPNVELVSTLTMVYTLVYRKYALIPIFVFIFLEGLIAGFGLWWYPYFYLWPFLWGVTMLLPGRMPTWLRVPVYAAVCGLFGLLYGSLYAPFQCYAFLGGDWSRIPAWIAAGVPYDVIHAIGNLALGTLIWPLTCLLLRLETDRSDTH
ncbi:MAG: hypothetical protein IJK69_02030 [Oscillospiraceae bacterium]|nr:hypothetical protein [Oscillospiraceae bacterium]